MAPQPPGRIDRGAQKDTAGHSGRSKRLRIIAIVVSVLAIGLAGRILVGNGVATSLLSNFLPWLAGTPVTLYFGDGSPSHLVPVSRTLTDEADSPQGLVDALLDGPAQGTGLVGLIPPRTIARSVTIDDSTMKVDLSHEYEGAESTLAHRALVQSLASWPGVDDVEVTVEGVHLDAAASAGRLLHYYDPDRDMLVAIPTAADNARDMLAAYLAGPDDSHLIGLPDDVEVLSLQSSAGSGLLVMDLTYSPSVREMATADGDTMRRVLQGLIATMITGFPQTNYVFLDFEGHATLGLGQCANLLRRVQPIPEVLNDEVLLTMRAEA